MGKKLFENLSFVLVFMIFVAVISSLLSVALTGYVINLQQTDLTNSPSARSLPLIKPISLIKANSCDADTICEVSEEITTKFGGRKDLLLISDTKIVKVDNQLTVNNIILKGNTVATKSNKILTLSSDSGSIIIEGNILASALMDESNHESDGYVCVTMVGVLIKKREPCV